MSDPRPAECVFRQIDEKRRPSPTWCHECNWDRSQRTDQCPKIKG